MPEAPNPSLRTRELEDSHHVGFGHGDGYGSGFNPGFGYGW